MVPTHTKTVLPELPPPFENSDPIAQGVEGVSVVLGAYPQIGTPVEWEGGNQKLLNRE